MKDPVMTTMFFSQASSLPGANSDSTPAAAPGRRLFIAGNVVLLLFSAVHMIPMFMDLFNEPTKPLEIEARRAMSAVAVDLGPFHTTMLGLNRLLSASYSALLFFVVAINFVTIEPVIAFGRLRTLAVVNLLFSAIMLAIALIYRFPPPAVFSLMAVIFFAMSGARSTESRGL